MRVMKWIGTMAVLATLSVLWAGDVKLVRLNSMPESKILHKELPAYPVDAADHRIQGVVKISVLIGADGRVERTRLISGHPLLTPGAMQAARRWTFEPTEVQGHAVRVITQISIPFDLDAHGNPVAPRPPALPLQ
jgi:TonB family protein